MTVNITNKPFPVLSPGDGPKFVQWEKLNEKWALVNHGQTLQQLANRGGLCPVEIYGNIREIRWGFLPKTLTPEMLEVIRSLEFIPASSNQ